MNDITGYIDRVSFGIVSGWAASKVSDTVSVSLYINGILVDETECTGIRKDVTENNSSFANKCGFFFKLNGNNLSSGDQVQVLTTKEKIELRNSPWKVRNEINKRASLRYEIRGKSLMEAAAIEPRPLICSKNRIGLMWSAKSGCTFASKWFFFQIGLLDAAHYYHPWIHRFREEVFYKSLPYQKALSRKDLSDFLLFKVVRSPFSRAVSSYIHAIRFEYENQQISEFLGRPIFKDAGFSFREFVDYLRILDVKNCNIHHRIQVHPLEEYLGALTVVKLENSIRTFGELEREYNLAKSPLSQYQVSDHNSARTGLNDFQGDIRFNKKEKVFPHFECFYNTELIIEVSSIYREDFDKYEYSTDINDHFMMPGDKPN
ncbi:MAG: sulfotransferase family protein [Saprospiraceae bacterium]|nr:sulfotransferase family protein [Saprospiraceae bacterium]